MAKLQLATVFSGIGAIEFALKQLNIEYDVVFACDNGEREIEYEHEKEFQHIKSLSTVDEKREYVEKLYSKKTRKTNFVQKSYLANYRECCENRFFQDIKLLDGSDFKGKVDLLVGGSPCQSFSTVGFQKGLDDARGTLFYEYARLIKEIEPKVFIYENVRGLTTHDSGNTWEIIKGIFESLGYNVTFDILNACDFGIPQNRRRLFVVGTKIETGFDVKNVKKIDLHLTMQDFLIENAKYGTCLREKTKISFTKKVSGITPDKYFLTPKLYAYVMKGGTKSFFQNPQIDLKIARTILKTMGNRHRAGIDNYVTVNGKVRMLTEEEAHRLMGFTDEYNIVVSRNQAYKQAGNSIVVDVLIAILNDLKEYNLI